MIMTWWTINTFYFYIDGAFRESIAVDNDMFKSDLEQASGNAYGYQAGDSFIFGFSSFNVADSTPIQFSNVVEKYANDALTELITNSVYANVGATA